MPIRSIAIETATDVCSVALSEDGRAVALTSLRMSRRHAEMLAPVIQSLLHQSGWTMKDVDYVAVSDGPGSYTGLRIGVSTAKGICYAAGLPLVAASTLEALADQTLPMASTGDVIVASFDARRGNVYSALYRVSEDGALTEYRSPVVAKAADLAAVIPQSFETTWLVGDGSAQIRAERYLKNERMVDVSPSAESVARIAHLRWLEGETEDVATFEPRYLREFIAEKPARNAFEKLPF